MADFWSRLFGRGRRNGETAGLACQELVELVSDYLEGALSEAAMVQTTNRFFDEVARLMNDAAGTAQGVRREFETLFRNQAERILRELDVVRREDFEAVKDMARIAREENEALKARVAALEGALARTTDPAVGPGTA
jgi:BMFP domain-containing protein YqiC